MGASAGEALAELATRSAANSAVITAFAMVKEGVLQKKMRFKCCCSYGRVHARVQRFNHEQLLQLYPV